jgi:hypothetical protein
VPCPRPLREHANCSKTCPRRALGMPPRHQRKSATRRAVKSACKDAIFLAFARAAALKCSLAHTATVAPSPTLRRGFQDRNLKSEAHFRWPRLHRFTRPHRSIHPRIATSTTITTTASTAKRLNQRIALRELETGRGARSALGWDNLLSLAEYKPELLNVLNVLALLVELEPA